MSIWVYKLPFFSLFTLEIVEFHSLFPLFPSHSFTFIRTSSILVALILMTLNS